MLDQEAPLRPYSTSLLLDVVLFPMLSLIPRVRARGRSSPTHIVFVLPRLAVETVPPDSPSKFLGLLQSMQVRLWLGLGNLLPLQPGIDRCQS